MVLWPAGVHGVSTFNSVQSLLYLAIPINGKTDVLCAKNDSNHYIFSSPILRNIQESSQLFSFSRVRKRKHFTVLINNLRI